MFGLGDVPLEYVDADGVTWRLFGRFCGSERQLTWVPDLDPEDIAWTVRDDIRELIAAPRLTLAPPDGLQVVNLETWLSVAPQPDIVRSGFIPGLTVTVTAAPDSITWVPDADGSLAPPGQRSDRTTIVCEPWGAPPPPDGGIDVVAPCGWTPRWRGTASSSVSVLWTIDWVADDGRSGSLEPIEVTTTYTSVVGEIQIVGESNTSSG